MSQQYKLHQFTNEKEFIEGSCEFIYDIIKNAIAVRGNAVIGLSGGTSPKAIYAALTVPSEKNQTIDWTRVFFYSVDERYIGKESPDSLYHLVRHTIFADSTPVSGLIDKHFTTPDTSLALPECINKYKSDLSQLVQTKSDGAPDLSILGMGEDGHIASIFPQMDSTPDKHIDLPTDLVYHTTTTRFAIFDRITTNLNFLTSSRNKLFFMKGESKKKVWDEMVAQPTNPYRWPAQAINQSGHSNVFYLV
ncbi:6-phosphogluconolactonase [Cavenderia fasciculata]|uniref:6-phosphogluconolactonase n=1 Tax=Cavenderia fasciculata TaxID=261658 RepID=F4PSB2_CACFS|nr:6-phosphogluconolactonase [Cavenderia fasciculata]EGG20658.1 6-phosphogluconolactonase [Cavenderia fasciculata]|eukprot:XP_004358508.1 6-phosphogluconolactonase [Cavenderia fasciculata]